jgi:hypothetical protein
MAYSDYQTIYDLSLLNTYAGANMRSTILNSLDHLLNVKQGTEEYTALRNDLFNFEKLDRDSPIYAIKTMLWMPAIAMQEFGVDPNKYGVMDTSYRPNYTPWTDAMFLDKKDDNIVNQSRGELTDAERTSLASVLPSGYFMAYDVSAQDRMHAVNAFPYLNSQGQYSTRQPNMYNTNLAINPSDTKDLKLFSTWAPWNPNWKPPEGFGGEHFNKSFIEYQQYFLQNIREVERRFGFSVAGAKTIGAEENKRIMDNFTNKYDTRKNPTLDKRRGASGGGVGPSVTQLSGAKKAGRVSSVTLLG